MLLYATPNSPSPLEVLKMYIWTVWRSLAGLAFRSKSSAENMIYTLQYCYHSKLVRSVNFPPLRLLSVGSSRISTPGPTILADLPLGNIWKILSPCIQIKSVMEADMSGFITAMRAKIDIILRENTIVPLFRTSPT